MHDGRVYLVRHAKAGSRSDWDDEDELRPLSKNGWEQAAAIAQRLASRAPSSLLTSPYLRCRQTLEPLAALTDLSVIEEIRLSEGAPFAPVVDLLAAIPADAVLCSHGDIIPQTIAALQRRGCHISTPADWRKGTIWTIERIGGEFGRAKVWSPPS